MPSVVGLLEQQELAARRRVDGLREEADRVQAELAAAEEDWREWVITRRRIDAVLAPGNGASGPEAGANTRDTNTRSGPDDAAKPKSQVPMWCQGMTASVLSVDYQRIVQVLADRVRLGQGPLTCQEMASVFGMDVVPARVETLRSKAKRLVARSWLAEPMPGQFTLAQNVDRPGGGS
ncbi:hypothetical protein [Streptomyces mirabilis]|jgi:hypothetical protein|uniref:hypothetical protein n=1 Tax=Streptomyces mirabilis TaxID=68239 RepID=UPI00381BF1BC